MSAGQDTKPQKPGYWQPAVTRDPLLRKHGALGQPVSRIDGPLKVQGAARFAAEFPYDNICYAALAFSTVARARISQLHGRITPLQHPYRDVVTVKRQVTIDPASNVK